MPRYVYLCENCNCKYEFTHSMKEIREVCEVCNTKTLARIPFFSGKVSEIDLHKAGSIVETFIKDAREEINQEKNVKPKEYKKQ